MILTRIADRLRKQDWIAVGIEILIVVVGVFIGLQANNWNEARVEAARVRSYFVRIHDDLETDLVAIDRKGAFYDSAQNYAREALSYAESGKLSDGSFWKTILAFYQAGQFFPNIFSDSTYREMASSGDLRLIRNQGLSAALGAYYSGRDDSEKRLFSRLPAFRETIRGLTPSSVQDYVFANCYSQIDTGHMNMLDCGAPVSEKEAEMILHEIIAEPQLLRQLRFWTTQMGIMKTTAGAERAAAFDLAAQVALEIDR